MSFVSIDLTVDPDQIADDATDYLQTTIPGWEPSDGHLEQWLIEAIARMTSEAVTVAAEVPAQVFAAFGAQFLGVSQRLGTAAAGLSTWVVESDQGYLIPGGTLVAYRTSGNSAISLETVDDVTVPVGSTSITGVALRAVDVGMQGNGISAGTELELVDSLSYVVSVTVSATTSGGVDPETDASYLDRLSTELRLLTPRPILPADFAVLAARIPGVYRALGISGYNPDDDTDDNERTVAVALVAQDGTVVDAPVHAAVVAYLDSLREVNFIVHSMDPTFTVVNVAYSVKVATGYVAADVLALIDETLGAVLSPAIWGGGDASSPVWSPESKVVRFFSISNVISSVSGVAYVAALTINGSATDLTLAGAAPLPTVGTIAGTAV